MYLPRHFEQPDPAQWHALMQASPLATLVTLAGPARLEANHIPLHFTPNQGDLGILRGHVAKANPLWQQHPQDVPVLAIFHGPQAYVSPSWYPTKAENHKAVPTWNYVVLHVYGRMRVTADAPWLRQQIEALTQQQEATMPTPWQVDDAPATYIDAMLRAIVGIEIAITHVQGKWKVSQNQPECNQLGVERGLRASADPAAHTMAAWVELQRTDSPEPLSSSGPA